MAKKYKFRREDTGKVVWVDYATMIQHSHGWITLPDGVSARMVHESSRWKKRTSGADERPTGRRAIVSDAMGFGQHQLADFEADRKANGFTDVEFVRDPQVPEFFQVKCGSRETYNRYARHRGYDNKNSMGGVRLSDAELRRAAEFVKERYGCAGNTMPSR